jgi:hypothetical protein
MDGVAALQRSEGSQHAFVQMVVWRNVCLLGLAMLQPSEQRSEGNGSQMSVHVCA